MARGQRVDIGDLVYHVINRSNGRVRIFENEYDYADFEYLLNELRETFEMRILAYVIMPNHWHLLLYPRKDGDLSRTLHWLTTSHVRRHHARKGTIGNGHLYQGTYRSFLVQTDAHLLTVLKYIERNAVRAKLSERAETWKWGSAYRRIYGHANSKKILAELPVDLPKNYRCWVNEVEPAELLKELRQNIAKAISYGQIDLPVRDKY